MIVNLLKYITILLNMNITEIILSNNFINVKNRWFPNIIFLHLIISTEEEQPTADQLILFDFSTHCCQFNSVNFNIRWRLSSSWDGFQWYQTLTGTQVLKPLPVNHQKPSVRAKTRPAKGAGTASTALRISWYRISTYWQFSHGITKRIYKNSRKRWKENLVV